MTHELPDLRSMIDHTALEVMDAEESAQPRLIAERALAHVAALRAQQPQLTQEEVDRVLEALMNGILKRLEQMETAGGRFGSA